MLSSRALCFAARLLICVKHCNGLTALHEELFMFAGVTEDIVRVMDLGIASPYPKLPSVFSTDTEYILAQVGHYLPGQMRGVAISGFTFSWGFETSVRNLMKFV